MVNTRINGHSSRIHTWIIDVGNSPALHIYHLCPAVCGFVTRGGGAEAETRGAAFGVPLLQVECALLALGTLESLHVVFAQTLGRALVTDSGDSTEFATVTAVAVWEAIEASHTHITPTSIYVWFTAEEMIHIVLLRTI